MRSHYYHLYGVTLQSEIVFPEFAALETKRPTQRPEILFRQTAPRPLSKNGIHRPPPRSTIWSKQGRAVTIEAALSGQFRVRIPQREIVWQPSSPTASTGLARAILKGDALATLLTGLPSYLVLHGNVVHIDGKTVALCAPSRTGKSTLTSCLLAIGARLHSDDLVVLRYEKGLFWAEPGPPELRLWPRSALFADRLRLKKERVYPETRKNRFRLGLQHSTSLLGKAIPLHAVYFMWRKSGGVTQILSLAPRERLECVFRSLYPLAYQNTGILAKQFALAAKLTESVPLKSLSFPSGYAKLPAIRSVLMENLKGWPGRKL